MINSSARAWALAAAWADGIPFTASVTISERIFEEVCKGMRIPFVHGAIAGSIGQVTTVFPEDKGLSVIYSDEEILRSGIEKHLGTPCITPTLVAGWQVSEVIQILLGWENTLRNRVLVVDLKQQVIEIVPPTCV